MCLLTKHHQTPDDVLVPHGDVLTGPFPHRTKRRYRGRRTLRLSPRQHLNHYLSGKKGGGRVGTSRWMDILIPVLKSVFISGTCI